MIRVPRSEGPTGFAERGRELLEQFREKRGTNPQLTMSAYWKAQRPSLATEAEALRREFRSKCAFCESLMAHVSNPQVEHYRPKSRPEFEELVFEWRNWLLSCGRCNQKKWAHFPMCRAQPCLLDPGCDDPSEHLAFRDAVVVPRTERGEKTRSLLGLHRSPLEDARGRWLVKIDALLLLACSAAPAIFAEARRLLIWSMQVDAPYSAMTRAYLERKTPRLAKPASPHPEIRFADPMARLRALVEQHRSELVSLL